MNVLHVIPSISLKHGGPSYAIRAIAHASRRAGMEVVVATTDDDGNHARLESPLGTPIERDGVTHLFFRRDFVPYKISFGLARWLNHNIGEFDIVHIHALFSFASTAAAFIAAAKDVPYIVRPLGVLNRWGLENRRAILKRGSLALIERRILSRAAAVHYTSEAERLEAAKIGNWVAKLPSFVSPLPVGEAGGKELATASSSIGEQGANPNLTSDVRRPTSETRDQAGATEAARAEQFLIKFSQLRGKRVVLFLSRIDPKKGIELLLSAFAFTRSEFPDLALVIAGSGDPKYEARLREKAKQLGIDTNVIWTGFLSAEDKAEALAAAEIFVLPSYSENFGIAAAEAFAAGKACILSDQVGLAQDARRANAAVVTRCDAYELAEAVKRLLTDSAQPRVLGDAAREFARNYLSLDAVGKQLEEKYRAAASGELSVIC